MTAEIAIMNRHAVALAADSAVTIGSDNPKIYNTVNKLFTLSKHRPVGVMVYGSATFMSVPWETIIKVHRENLQETEFNTLREYAESLLSDLRNNASYVTPEDESFTYGERLEQLYRSEAKIVTKRLGASGIDPNDMDALKAKAEEIIEARHADWSKVSRLTDCPEGYEALVRQKHTQLIQKNIASVFGDFPLTDKSKIHLAELGIFIQTKDRWPVAGRSGVVIAGFGKDEIYPGLVSFQIEAKLEGFLKAKEMRSRSIDRTVRSRIIPFAQGDVINMFMRGIDPDYKTMIASSIKELSGNLPAAVTDLLKQYLPPQKVDDITADLQKRFGDMSTEFLNGVEEYESERYISPIMDAVDFLPKDELAVMAESLVSLTAFKQKMTLSTETVGGPIDVAIITKGDGFIWIKRKHYFDPKLNQHFFHNYFRRQS